MKKIIILLILTIGLFSSCKMDLLTAETSSKNAYEYAAEGNKKYTLIEVNEAITYSKQALSSCKGVLSSNKFNKLSKNLASLYEVREDMEGKSKDTIITNPSSVSRKIHINHMDDFEQDKQDCNKGDSEKCYKIGRKYFKGEGAIKSPSLALEYYVKSCNFGNIKVCNDAANIYLMGLEGVLQDYGKAAKFFEKACDGNNARGCIYVAALYVDGAGVPKDKIKAIDFYNKGCNLGNKIGCKRYLELMP